MTRRGLALLMVLAVLVISSSAVLSIVRVGVNDQLGKSQHRELVLADELLASSEPAVLDWLAEKAERSVLPPDAAQPGVLVLHDEFELGDYAAVVEITAWDQAGMVTPDLLRLRPEFEGSLPESTRRAVGTLPVDSDGLDRFPRKPEQRVFPSFADQQPALGASIATHNPIAQPGRNELPVPLININTAPLAIIEAALGEAGIDAIEPLRAARAEGRRVGLAGISVGELAGYRLVGSSSVWAVRTDATVGHTRRSWWTVYANHNGRWEKVQRLVIDQ